MMHNFFKRILSSIILIPLSFYFIFYGSYVLLLFTLICFLISSYEWHMMTKKKNYNIAGFIFLSFSFYTFYQCSNSLTLVFFVILICISTDIGGYIFGNVFKGPKLTKISPKKTYAGMIGSYLFSLISLFIAYNLYDYSLMNNRIILLTIIISTVSQIGDLIISYFKRLSKVKDTGKIIPGHGGLLDRIDGMIFTFPIIFLIQLAGYLHI
jgi:phosphatidate cytidylyltransferase